MKKLLTITATFALLTGALSSCNKCYECDYGNGDVRELCPKDFPDKAEGLRMTVKALEDQGYTCEAK